MYNCCLYTCIVSCNYLNMMYSTVYRFVPILKKVYFIYRTWVGVCGVSHGNSNVTRVYVLGYHLLLDVTHTRPGQLRTFFMLYVSFSNVVLICIFIKKFLLKMQSLWYYLFYVHFVFSVIFNF